MADRRTDLPPVNAPNFLEKLREAVSTYLGNRGDRLDRGLTVRDLSDAGLIELSAGYLSSNGKISPVAGVGGGVTDALSDAYVVDLTPPPSVEGFAAVGAFENIIITVTQPTYTMGHGHGRTRIYGNSGSAATEQGVVDWAAAASGVLQASVGIEPGNSLFNEVFSSRKLGDVDGLGTCDLQDGIILNKYADAIAITAPQTAYIEGVLGPKLLSNPVKYAAYIAIMPSALLMEFQGTVASYPATTGSNYNLWATNVTNDGVESVLRAPVGSPNGLRVTTALNVPAALAALAEQITTSELSAALNSTISTNTTQITNARNLYTIKMDVNGSVSGFGLSSTLADTGVATSRFIASVNQFAVVAPASAISTWLPSTAYVVGQCVKWDATSTSKMLVCKSAGNSGASSSAISNPLNFNAIGSMVTADGTVVWQIASRVPFSVTTTSFTDSTSGQVIPPGVYLDGAAISNATINNAQIANLAVDNAKIANLAVDKLTAGSMQVGSYIRSTSYTPGSVGWNIPASGSAEFSNVTVRGAVYATSGLIGGNTIDATSIRSGQTAYDTGTGFWLGSTGSFSLGNSAGNKLTWNGTTLSVVGSITASSGFIGGNTIDSTSVRSGQTAYDTGTGFWLGSNGKFSLGNWLGNKLTWDNTSLAITGALTATSIATNSGKFTVSAGGILTAVEADIQRRVILATGTFSPAALGSVSTGPGSPTTVAFSTLIDTGITDSYLVGTSFCQQFGVSLQAEGTVTYTGGDGYFYFSGRALCVVNRTYSPGGVATANDGKVYVHVMDLTVIGANAGSFSTVDFPTYRWKVYKL